MGAPRARWDVDRVQWQPGKAGTVLAVVDVTDLRR
jgi:hypothetical protein